MNKNPLLKQEEKNLSAIGSMLGHNCLKSVHNISYSTLHERVFSFLVAWEVKEIMPVVPNKTKDQPAADCA